MVLEFGLEKKTINLGLVLKYSQLYINLQTSFIWRNYSQKITVSLYFVQYTQAKNAWQQLLHMIKQELDWIDKTWINKIWIDKKEIKMKLVMQCQQRNSPLVCCTCRVYILLIK